MDSIRKFGLEYCDLPTMLWNIAVMLRVLVLNIESGYKKSTPLIYYLITCVGISTYIYVYLISTIYYVGWKYPDIQDTVVTLILLSLSVSSEIGILKYFYMLLTRKTLVDIIDDMIEHDSTVESNRMKVSILKTMRTVKKRALIFWFVIMSNGVVYVFKPFVLPGRHLIEDDQIILGLEPMFESPNYEIAIAVTFVGVLHICFVPANVTALFIILIGYIEAQMSALTVEMNNLWPDAKLKYEKETNKTNYIINNEEYKVVNDNVREGLKDLIKRHSTVITLLRRLENVYRTVIAIEFLLLIIGLIFELLGGLENTYIEVPYALMQVFMDCLTGQKLLEASMAFEEAVYFSGWENFDVDNRKTLVMMLLSSQKYLTMSAGGVKTLSYTSFLGIIRSVYSAYATLQRAIHRV